MAMTGVEVLARMRLSEQRLYDFVQNRMEGLGDAGRYIGEYDRDHDTLALANTAAVAAGRTLLLTKQWDVTTITITANVHRYPGGKINNSGTVTFTGRFSMDGTFSECFIGTGAVLGDALEKYRPMVTLSNGQSNMATTVNQIGGPGFELDPDVYLWNTSVVGASTVFGTQFNVATWGVAPLDVGSSGDWSRPIDFAMAKELRKRTGRPQYVVKVARGAHAIEAFISDAGLAANNWTRPESNQDLSLLMYPGLRAALDKVPGKPATFDIVALHQGEANENNSLDGPEGWATKVDVFLNELVTAGFIGAYTTKIMIGELTRSTDNSHRVRHSYAIDRLQGIWKTVRKASSFGLATIGGGVHFTGFGLTVLGQRYADCFWETYPLRDFSTEDPKFGTDHGSYWLTTSQEPSIESRGPIGLGSSAFTLAKAGPLGDSFYKPAGAGFFCYTRKIFRLPVAGGVPVSYEMQVESGTGEVIHRPIIYGYDKDMNKLMSKAIAPTGSPATAATGRVLVEKTFGRPGSGADLELTPTNLFANPSSPATQTVAVDGEELTLSFYGTGSIVYSGVASGTLAGTGVGNKVSATFTPTAGNLVLTVSGTITTPELVDPRPCEFVAPGIHLSVGDHADPIYWNIIKLG